jgi:hypothetical protein
VRPASNSPTRDVDEAAGTGLHGSERDLLGVKTCQRRTHSYSSGGYERYTLRAPEHGQRGCAPTLSPRGSAADSYTGRHPACQVGQFFGGALT